MHINISILNGQSKLHLLLAGYHMKIRGERINLVKNDVDQILHLTFG